MCIWIACLRFLHIVFQVSTFCLLPRLPRLPEAERMVNPFKAMANIFRRIRSKRKLSSELDTRWGDASISYPTGGSWSQYDQTGRRVDRTPSDRERARQGSLDSFEQHSLSPHWTSRMHSPHSIAGDRDSPFDPATTTIPTGHYDASVRHRSTRTPRTPKLSPGPGLGIGPLQNKHNHNDDHNHHHQLSTWESSDSDEDSSDDEATDSSSAAEDQPRRYLTVNVDDSDYSRPARSPPLSVTSRMRRCSQQSSMTEPTTSIPRVSQSRHTRVTSLPLERSRSSEGSQQDSHQRRHRHDRQTSQDKRHIRRPGPLGMEPIRTPELVPSYEELYE